MRPRPYRVEAKTSLQSDIRIRHAVLILVTIESDQIKKKNKNSFLERKDVFIVFDVCCALAMLSTYHAK